MNRTPEFKFPATVFSQNRVYRYTLSRQWFDKSGRTIEYTPGSNFERFVQFIGLNPSKADEERNDNTVTKCINYARRWGFGGMVMTNIFALRSTDPEGLYKWYRKDDDSEANQEENLPWVTAVADQAALIVACWGNHGEYLGRGKHYADMLRQKYPRKLATLARPGMLLRGEYEQTREGESVISEQRMPAKPRINANGHPTHPCRESGSLVWAPWDGRGVSQ